MTEKESKKSPASCDPIGNLFELLTWVESKTSWNVTIEPKAQRADYSYDGSLQNDIKYYKASCPRTLLCHDMKGGYLEDRYVHGASDVDDPYIFTHWAFVDSFVYFSHHFVTIPPVGWINAAHLHGVQILGTVITEWTDGEKLWQQVFEDDTKMNLMIRKLVDVCKLYKFDGYLINIENKIPLEHLDKMKRFVKDLTELTHREVNESMIIWYDSVISPSGELKWQNELNESNKEFFQNCDGIFLNYNWTDDTLKTTLQNAGVRKHDVYVGVDVFGRGCYGGGGFNSDLALAKIRQHNMSAAIFAHAWTHEAKSEVESFQQREALFWSKLKPHCYAYVLVNKSLYTCFNNGYGKYSYLNGYKEKEAVQYNLSRQSLQTLTTPVFVYEDGFNGTGCIKLKKTEDKQYHVLFLNQIFAQKFKVRLATKCSTSYDYDLILYFDSHMKKQFHKFILKKEEKMREVCDDFSSSAVHECETSSDSDRNKKTLVWFKCSWDVKTFVVESLCPGYISEIGIRFQSDNDSDLLLGELKIYSVDE